jgi:hypothetical protein
MMLTRITAIEHQKPMASGRTHPSRLVCEAAEGSTIEVVAKFSAGCDWKEASLAREAVAACLAVDLGLPIPEAFLVDIPAELAGTVADREQRARIEASSPVAFGSRLMTGGYAVWHSETHIDETMLPVAAAILVFDALVNNVDRRAGNPNCLVRGNEIRIFDHELAFTHGVTLGWKPPWVLGALKALETPGFHIFREGLSGREIDFAPIRAAWTGLSDDRITAYETGLPGEWSSAAAVVKSAVALIRDARDNIDACLTEVKRVLT